MRWASMMSVLLLASGGSLLPKLIAKATGVRPGDAMKLAESVRRMNSAEAVEEKIDRQLDALDNGRAEELSLPELAAVQDAVQEPASDRQPDRQEVANALLTAFRNQEPLGSKIRRGTLKDSETLRRVYRRHRPLILPVLNLLAVPLAAVGVLGLFAPIRPWARGFLNFTFSQSGLFLVWGSALAAVYYGITRINPWQLLPLEVLGAPTGYMVVSGACLRILDPNVPVWNSMLKSMASPVLSVAAVVGCAQVWKS